MKTKQVAPKSNSVELKKAAKASAKAIEKEVKIMTTREIFMYSKPKANHKKSRVTIAGIIDEANKTISLHGAKNHSGSKDPEKRDVFNRKIGAQVAAGRARKHPVKVVSYTEIAGKNNAREIFVKEANVLIKKSHRLFPKKD